MESEADRLPEADVAYYVLDGQPVLLHADRGPVTPSGDRVDCRVWMDRASLVSRDEYLAVIAAATSIATMSAALASSRASVGVPTGRAGP